jgi:hypothetical protein
MGASSLAAPLSPPPGGVLVRVQHNRNADTVTNTERRQRAA